MNRFLIIITILLFSISICAQTYKYTNEFMSIGVGARSFAMANSTITSVKGESATYWNPAALTQQINPMNIGLMHAEYFAGLSKFDFIGTAFKIDKKASFGASLIRFAVDDIPDTRKLIDENGNIQFDKIRSFSAADYAFYLSYARTMPVEGLSIGGNVKIIRRIVGKFASSWGFGIDASALYTYKQWNFAAVLRDATTTFNSWNYNLAELKDIYILTGNAIPHNGSEVMLPRLLLGASYDYSIGKKFGVLGELNFDITTDGKRNVLLKGDPFSIDPHVGIEAYYKKIVFLRAGIGNIQKEPGVKRGEQYTTVQPNIGLGLKIKQITIDYALTDIGNVSVAGYSHVFSLSFAVQNIKK